MDDYGARTGKSPGKMRQLNINGDLYVGECSLFTFRTQKHFCVCEVGCKTGHPSSVQVKAKASCGSLWSSTAWFLWRGLSGWDVGDWYEKGPAPWGALWYPEQVHRERVSVSCKPHTLVGIWAQDYSALSGATISAINN